MILEKRLKEAEEVAFFEEFDERFGGIGRDPVSYYSFEIGHILHITPDQVGEVTPADLLAAMQLYDALYRND